MEKKERLRKDILKNSTIKALVKPGDIIKEEIEYSDFKTQKAVMDVIELPNTTFYDAISGRGRITARVALALEKVFEPSAEEWLSMQAHYDLKKERDKSLLNEYKVDYKAFEKEDNEKKTSV